MKKYIVPLLAGVLAGCMLAFPGEATKAAVDACRLWAVAVLPSLFPFLACMLLITGCLPAGGKSGVSRFLGLPRQLLPTLILGLMSGSPGGSRLSQEISAEDGPSRRAGLVRFALYAGTMSPMFFVGTLGGWLKNPALGWVLLSSHWLGAFITGQLSRLVFPCEPIQSGRDEQKGAAPNLGIIMNAAATAMLTVCGLMVLGSVAAQMAQCSLPGLPKGILAGIQAFLEVTAGCSRILSLPLNGYVPALRPALLCAAASFGGMSILLQNFAFLQKGGVSLTLLLLGRLCHAILSFGFCFLFYPLASQPASPAFAQTIYLPSAVPWAFLGLFLLSLLLPPFFRRQKPKTRL